MSSESAVDPTADRPAEARVSGDPAVEPAADRPVGADATAAPSEGLEPTATSRLSDRTLWLLLAAGLVALLLAIAFAFWINAAGPLHPVPVASRPSA